MQPPRAHSLSSTQLALQLRTCLSCNFTACLLITPTPPIHAERSNGVWLAAPGDPWPQDVVLCCRLHTPATHFFRICDAPRSCSPCFLPSCGAKRRRTTEFQRASEWEMKMPKDPSQAARNPPTQADSLCRTGLSVWSCSRGRGVGFRGATGKRDREAVVMSARLLQEEVKVACQVGQQKFTPLLIMIWGSRSRG